MIWSGKRVLVTGAGGFVGGHLVRKLMEVGAEVRGLCRYSSCARLGSLELLAPEERPEIVFGDLRDADAIRAAVKGCEIVFHLGAIISVPYSRTHPREVMDTNIGGAMNVLTAARDLGAKVVIPSTSEVYGTAQYVPIDEAHPQSAQQAYAASKIASDKLAESFWYVYELPVATLRPFNTYGPWQSTRPFIPSAIVQALVNREVRMGYADPTRDFTYVSDVVDAYIAAIECDCVWGQVVNLGTGVEVRIGDLCERICELAGGGCQAIEDDQRKGPARAEVWRLCSDNTKARKVMGWEPKVSMDEGLRLTVEWIRAHLDFYGACRYTP